MASAGSAVIIQLASLSLKGFSSVSLVSRSWGFSPLFVRALLLCPPLVGFYLSSFPQGDWASDLIFILFLFPFILGRSPKSLASTPKAKLLTPTSTTLSLHYSPKCQLDIPLECSALIRTHSIKANFHSHWPHST